jgi:hypothetical protein
MQYQYANYSENYIYRGKGSIRLQLINQRSDFSFALFTGGLDNVREMTSAHYNCQSRPAGRLYISSLHPSMNACSRS